MRKHFLLLLLMTLLPLAGWAADHEVEVTLSSSPSIVWQGFSNENKPAVQKAWITVKENGSAVSQTVKAAVAEVLEFRNLDNYNVGDHSIQLQLHNANVDKVTVSGEDYYIVIADATRTLTITKLEGDVEWTGAPSYVAGDLTYNGGGQALLTAGAVANIGGIYVPVSYTLNPTPEQGDPVIYNSFDAVEATNAGEYTVYYKVIGTDNYDGTANWVQMTSTKEIAKATNTISGLTHANWTYNPEKTEPSATGENPDITVTATVGAADAVFTYAKWNGEAYGEPGTYAAIVGGNAGKYKLIATIPATNNYSEATSNVEFTIAKATNSITDLTLDGWTYDPAKTEPSASGENPAITFNATVGAANAVFTYAKKTSGVYGEAGTYDEKVGGHAGTYKLKATIAETENYTEATSEVEFTIAKATPVLNVDGVINTAWNLYDGENHNLFLQRATATIGETTLGNTAIHYNARYKAPGGSYGSWFGDKTNPANTNFTNKKDAGSYQVQIWVDGTADYNAVYHKPNNEFVRIDVAKANITGYTEPVAKTGLRANGTHALVEAATWGDNTPAGTFAYSLNGTDWVADVPTTSVAGDYTVYFKMTPTDATNYNVFTNSYAVSIAAANPAYIIPVAKSKAYGANDPELTWTVSDGTTTLDNSVLKGTVTLARTNGNNVGTYTIYVKNYIPAADDTYTVLNVLGDPENTTDDNKTAVFTITADPESNLQLAFTADAIANKSTKVYDGTTDITALAFDVDDLEVVDGLLGSDTWDKIKGGATITFALESANAYAENNKVTATLTAGLTNYANVTIADLPFTVTKKKLAVEVGDQEVAYGGPIASVENTDWALAAGSAYADGESNTQAGIVLYTVDAISSYAPGSETEGAIQAKIEGTSNYEILPEGNTGSTWGKLTITAVSPTTVLALNSTDADLAKIEAYNGQNVNVTIDFSARNGRGVNWKADTWVTMTLPFNISVAKLSQALGYAIVNVIDPSRTEIDGTGSKFYGKLTMKGGNGDGTEDYLVANKPFMVKIADNIADVNGGVIDFGSQTIIAPADADDLTVDAGYGAKFIGTYATRTVTPADNKAIWFLIGSNNQWLFIGNNGSWDVLPFEGYIDMSNASAPAAHNMTFYFEELDGSTTAIKGISTDELNGKMAEGMYNMNGMKLNTVPTQKGVYILNGKKVVIK